MCAQKDERPEQTLLEELCGADAELYALLSLYLYHTPLAAVSEKALDTLIDEAEESGDYRPAIDKAIFEGSQNLGERARYADVIRNLASKSIHAAEQATARLDPEGLSRHGASLERRVKDHRLMSERADDILGVAAKFYSEKLVNWGENVKREARQEERKRSEREERAIGKREKTDRDAGRRERRRMSRGERREAKKREKLEDVAAEERRRVREDEKTQAETEERRIGEREEAARNARRNERKGN